MTDYNDGTNVLVSFETFNGETDKAYKLDDEWYPKSQVAHMDIENKQIWVPEWLAKKKGVDYK